MACQRCKKEHTNDITFSFKFGKEKVRVEAIICKVCGFIGNVEDKQMLEALRKNLKWVTQQEKQKKTSQK